MSIQLQSQICRNPSVLYTEIDQQYVLMNAEKGLYFELNSVGSEIWQQLESPLSVESLCLNLNEVFEVEASNCQQETLVFLDKLLDNGLIVVD